MVDRFLKSKEACEILNVHPRTLYQWESKGWIETVRSKGNVRMYNVDKYLREVNIKNDNDKCIKEEDYGKLDTLNKKLNISYVRVSTVNQKEDLERQEQAVKAKYPDNVVIKDIGSGLNLNRKGLRKIIELGIAGKVDTVVVAYRDRLTRFGFELIEDIIDKYSKGKIIVLNKKNDLEPEEELTRDVLELMNVFTAKMNGLRKYRKNQIN